MQSQQQSLIEINRNDSQKREYQEKLPNDLTLKKYPKNQKSTDKSSFLTKEQSESDSITIYLKQGLIVAVILALSLGLWLFYNDDPKWSNNNNSIQRLLNEMPLEDSITKRLSADVVPRWYDLTKQDDQFVYLSDSQPLPSIMNIISSSSLKHKEKDDILSIIFDNSTHLNYEIVAGITGEKMKLGSKLLNLNRKSNQHEKFIYQFQSQYYQSKYNISRFEEKPICVVVPTYFNAEEDRDKINIRSIIGQQYSNFHIVIIDDASRDKTADRIQLELQKNNFDPLRYVLIRNKQQMKAMYNIRTAAKKYCLPDDIMMIVDGDDVLIGRQVFKLFNAAFQSENAWFVYSNFLDMSSKNIGFSRSFPQAIIERNSYRLYLFLTSHLRAFYTKLFLKIREEDLQDSRGQYYEAANDVAICLPILQMSHKRVFYLPELTYGYNSNTGNNNHIIRSIEQNNNNVAIRQKSKYQPLKNLNQI